MGLDINFWRNWSWKTNTQNARIGNTNENMVSDAMPRYYDAALQGNTFFCANQGATTWSAALNTTFTGLLVCNPANSGKNMIVKKVGFTMVAAPSGIVGVFIFGGYTAAGVVPGTGLTCYNTKLNNGGVSAMLGGSAATTVNPLYIMPLSFANTSAALPTASGVAMTDLEGCVIVPPGGYIGIATFTAASGIGSIIWDEVPNT